MPLNCKLLPERVMKGLSGMIGNFHVPFLEEGKRVIASFYSALQKIGYLVLEQTSTLVVAKFRPILSF